MSHKGTKLKILDQYIYNNLVEVSYVTAKKRNSYTCSIDPDNLHDYTAYSHSEREINRFINHLISCHTILFYFALVNFLETNQPEDFKDISVFQGMEANTYKAENTTDISGKT